MSLSVGLDRKASHMVNGFLHTSNKYLIQRLIWTQNRAVLLFVRCGTVRFIRNWILVQVSHFDYDIVMQDADSPRREPPFNKAIAAGQHRNRCGLERYPTRRKVQNRLHTPAALGGISSLCRRILELVITLTADSDWALNPPHRRPRVILRLLRILVALPREALIWEHL